VLFSVTLPLFLMPAQSPPPTRSTCPGPQVQTTFSQVNSWHVYLSVDCAFFTFYYLTFHLISAGMTRADARRFLLPAPPSSLPASSACNGSSTHDELLSLPPSFDARVQWPNLFHASPDPGQCDPVAFVSATIFSDVVSIARSTRLTFSVQELLSCGNYECDSGAWPNKAFLYMTEKGLPSEACYPLNGSEFSQVRESCSDVSATAHRHRSIRIALTLLPSANLSALMAAPKLRAPSG
jgi:hypothetical protein